MGEYIGTIIVILVLVIVVGIAVWSVVRDKKKGKSINCGGDCKKCSGCH